MTQTTETNTRFPSITAAYARFTDWMDRRQARTAYGMAFSASLELIDVQEDLSRLKAETANNRTAVEDLDIGVRCIRDRELTNGHEIIGLRAAVSHLASATDVLSGRNTALLERVERTENIIRSLALAISQALAALEAKNEAGQFDLFKAHGAACGCASVRFDGRVS